MNIGSARRVVGFSFRCSFSRGIWWEILGYLSNLGYYWKVSLPTAAAWNERDLRSPNPNHSMISSSFVEGKILRHGPEFWGWNEGLRVFPVTFPKV